MVPRSDTVKVLLSCLRLSGSRPLKGVSLPCSRINRSDGLTEALLIFHLHLNEFHPKVLTI